MLNIKLSDNEVDIIGEITDLLLQSIEENDIEKHIGSKRRLIKLGFLNDGDNQLSVVELYAILNYLIWATRELHVFGIGRIELTQETRKIVNNLQAKINYALNKKLSSEFIYFDYDDSIDVIVEKKRRIVHDKLGDKYEQITLYPPIFKKFKEDNCYIKMVLCNDDKIILIPEHKTYYIYQEQIK